MSQPSNLLLMKIDVTTSLVNRLEGRLRVTHEF